jgi:YbbR domain-containing protein
MASFFRRITENWKLKLLAFGIAVLLWVVWSADTVTNEWIPVPLEVEVADARFRAAAPIAGVVEVRFSGAGRDLVDIAVRRPPLRLTVTEVNEESGEYALEPRMVVIPAQLSVNALDVRPRSVRLEFTRVDSRVIRVRPRIVDALGSDWVLADSVSVEPAEVRITGPMTQVGSVREVFTVPFELAPTDSIFERPVALDTAGLAGLTLNTGSVTISGRLDRIIETTVPNVPVDVGEGIRIQPARIEVRLRGPQRAVRAVSPGFFRVAISIDEIPAEIPEEGVLVPLRVDGIRPDVQATVNPSQVRLLPTIIAADTLLPDDTPAPADSAFVGPPTDGA